MAALAKDLVRSCIAHLRTWRHRSAERRALISASDKILRDIGITRYDVACEARKPFWRA
jgi:uncharacterized protein YjiS (DUF1127 family)